ncbi:MAG: YidC/Oxa1 family membrane protein insertase [Bacillota bacterium]
MIDAIAEVFSVLISFIYGYIPNFGIAIIIMTLMVKLVTFPLNNKQIKSAKKMQILQPEMKKIQNKYKDDKEKQNKAVQEFMKENNMNPLAGCLPLLVQFPVLIGVFRLLREPDLFLDMEVINPYLFQSSETINLLSLPMTTLSLESFISEISIYYIFPLIAGATTYLYSKMSMPADSSQKMLMYMMPAMITVFSFTFPVGLVIYWTMNNIFSIGQHKFITSMDNAKEELKEDIKVDTKAELKEKKEKGEKGSGKKEKDSKEDPLTRKLKEEEHLTVKPSNTKSESEPETKRTKPKGKKGKGKK